MSEPTEEELLAEADRLHTARERAAGRRIARLRWEPTASYVVNPDPERTSPSTEGLEVYFDDEGRCGLSPIAFPESGFVIGAAVARQLADLIYAHPRNRALATYSLTAEGAAEMITIKLPEKLAERRSEPPEPA
jgi:hypothetical protein